MQNSQPARLGHVLRICLRRLLPTACVCVCLLQAVPPSASYLQLTTYYYLLLTAYYLLLTTYYFQAVPRI